METTQTGQQPRAVLLYRASSKQQTDRANDCDIPLQRNILRPWIERQGWSYVREFVEGGVSGFKVSANDRDALIEIKKMAVRGEFDILAIYMSDRLGRIADETPLVVSFLNNHGIKVMSYNEGEIKANTHADKLMTYIRYWQAEGESLKTSLRVSDALADCVRAGRWRGGNIPYGYKNVSRGTLNFKGKPIFDVEIDDEQAAVVRTVFKLSRVDNYGTKRIARYLNDNRIPAQKGGRWGNTQVIQLLNNQIYKGIYVLHADTKNKPQIVSPVMESFIIIPAHEWDETQSAVIRRAGQERGTKHVTHGKLLLSGLVYCGTCGSKMTTLSQKSRFVRKDGTVSKKVHYKYICGSHYTPVTGGCAGQTSFSAPKIEKSVIEDVTKFITTLNHRELIANYLAKTEEELRMNVADAESKQAAIIRAEAERDRLKAEIVRTLMGTSSFSEDTIKDLLIKKEAEINELHAALEAVQKAVLRADTEKASYKQLSEELTDWGGRFERQDHERRKIMLLNVIDRIDVFRGRAEILYDIKVNVFAPIVDTRAETDYTTDITRESATDYPKTTENPSVLPPNINVNEYASAA